MKHKDHLIVDKAVFGQEYPEVHKWLDEMFPKYRGFSHWKERHHLEAISEKYGTDLTRYNVAILHIITDWISHLSIFALPKNKEAVEELLEI